MLGKTFLIIEKRGLSYISPENGGVYSIVANVKEGGLSGRAYSYTFSMGVPPTTKGMQPITGQVAEKVLAITSKILPLFIQY